MTTYPNVTMWKTIACLLFMQVGFNEAVVPCSDTSSCEKLLRPGSQCIDGFCSNPFERGCLRNYLGREEFQNMRTCNSHDGASQHEASYHGAHHVASHHSHRRASHKEALEDRVCQTSSMNYEEIRILSGNWESSMINAWILQIILSELVGVPTSIESSEYGRNLNFYDPRSSFDYGGSAYDFGALRTAFRVGDCRNVDRTEKNYTSCAHILPEGWAGQQGDYFAAQEEGIIDPPMLNGMVGIQNWYIPKFVVDRDPSLVYYGALSGEKNRRKVAETFKRPATWKEYCENVSSDGCETSDETAFRGPRSEDEEGRYFVEGLFNGYFRKTEKNDCFANPTTCTGHIVQRSCEWSSFATQQAYHNDIPVESDGPIQPTGGYTYHAMKEIWAAANSTKSNVMFVWWKPDSFYQSFLGSDSEFVPIIFPPPSQECLSSRVTKAQRCSADPAERVGSTLGACGSEPDTLVKAIVSSIPEGLREQPEALRSPAYEIFRRYTISELQMEQIFDYWRSGNIDRWNYDPRDAVCKWVAENLEQFENIVPHTYPRVLVSECTYQPPLFYVAICLGTLVSTLVILTGCATLWFRKEQVIIYAQLDFLYMLLVGLLMTASGSIVIALAARDPSQGTCIASAWLITLGYTMQLNPLVVKVAATNSMLKAAQKMKRVMLKRSDLHRKVVLLGLFAVVWLTLWTVFDPPSDCSHITLSEKTTDANDTIVNEHFFCSISNSNFWQYVDIAWRCCLLLVATVLAFQTRNLREDFNESRTLSFMIYSHFMFVVLLLVTFLLEQSVSHGVLEYSRSIIYSADVLVAVAVYFIPKFCIASGINKNNFSERRSSGLSADSNDGMGRKRTMTTNSVASGVMDPPLGLSPFDEIQFSVMRRFDEQDEEEKRKKRTKMSDDVILFELEEDVSRRALRSYTCDDARSQFLRNHQIVEEE